MMSRHSTVFQPYEERKSEEDCHPDQLHNNRSSGVSDERSIGGHEIPKELCISSIAGIIHNGEVESMKRIVFRISRGNALLHIVPLMKTFISEFNSPIQIHKMIYIITFQEGESLRKKLAKISESFNADRFDIPNENFDIKIREIEFQIKESK